MTDITEVPTFTVKPAESQTTLALHDETDHTSSLILAPRVCTRVINANHHFQVKTLLFSKPNRPENNFWTRCSVHTFCSSSSNWYWSTASPAHRKKYSSQKSCFQVSVWTWPISTRSWSGKLARQLLKPAVFWQPRLMTKKINFKSGSIFNSRVMR